MRVTVHLLEPEFDIDTEQDLSLLEQEINRRRDLGRTASELANILNSRTRVA